MTALGVATTYPADQLGEADLILPNLHGAHPERLCQRLAEIAARPAF